MTRTRSGSYIAFVLLLTSAMRTAVASEPAETPPGTRTETRAVALPMKPGPDGWYDASAPDDVFRIRMPGLFQAFAEEGTTDAGVATRTTGVRANLSVAFGAQTSYVASCLELKGDTRTAKQRLQAAIDRWDTIGTMRYRKNLESTSRPGLEFEMADDVKVLRARLYAPATGTCTLLVTWRPPAKPSEAELEKFFGSFEVDGR